MKQHLPPGKWTRRTHRALGVLVVLAVTLIAMLAATGQEALAAQSSSAAPVAAAVTRPTLRYGSTGSTVAYLQQRLVALHYDVGPVDGVFGYSTLHGVYAFQKVQRIGIDGVVGPVTWAKLAAPYLPRPRYTRSAAAVEVNLTLRVVYVTRNGSVTRILDASPGKPSTPTVTGSFLIYRRVNAWDLSPLGLLWRPNYFYRGYALHGSTSVPTYAASHGCVRVTVPAMNRLWSQLFIGEHVNVYR